MIFVRRVIGDSMQPTLKNGQVVLAFTTRKFKTGQVVIAFVDGREIIKRITKIEQGQITLLGDNPSHSTDSRQYGTITDSKIEGVVFWPKVNKL